jgi:hypothetical protein
MLLSSLWEPFGLRSSPFFQDELSPTAPDHPVTLFVGRAEERTRIVRRFLSDPKSHTIIQGDPGVGKTSFVNRLKADAAEYGIVSYEQPIRITSDTTRQTLIADTLRTLVRIRASAGRPTDDAFWSRTVRLLEGADLTGGGVSGWGFGGAISRGYVAPQAPPDSLFEHLGEALRRNHEDAGRPVLLHVNNLENLTSDGMRSTAQLLLDLRDYLQLDGAHWVFVGTTGVDEGISRVHKQVSGIFSEAETLAHLNSAEIAQMLALRYEHLTVPGASAIPPIVPTDGATLYTLYAGDLRNFLRLLSDAAERTLGLAGPRPMTIGEVLRVTRPIYARRLREHVGENDSAYLANLVAASPGGIPEFRVSDAARTLHVTQGGASQIIGRLHQARVISMTRQEGKSVYYQPTGPALVAFGFAPREGHGDLPPIHGRPNW